MALHWAAEPLAALREFHRVLAPDGLLMFSTLGPDTLAELRAAAGAERVHAFADMHDLGDMLLAAGFSAPVMDMETLTLAVRGRRRRCSPICARAARPARAPTAPRGLAGTAFSPPARRSRAAREASCRVTFEVVYGHAWKARRARRTDRRRTQHRAVRTASVDKAEDLAGLRCRGLC